MVLDPTQEADSSQTGRSRACKGRLTFVLYQVSAGGAQRVLTILANELSKRGWSVTLLTFDNGSEPPFFALHPDIQHWPLSVMREQGSWWKAVKIDVLRPWLLRKAIRRSRPDAVISFIDLMNIFTLVATVGLKIPVIISERAHPVFTQIWKFWSLLRKGVYNGSACLVVQTSDVQPFFSSLMQKKIRVIPNPVLVPCIDKILEPETNYKILLSMGRLCEQKGFDLLLKAFAPLCNKFPDWLLEVWGEGEQKAVLEGLRDDLCLQQRVTFPGLVKEPYKIMSRADIFVLSSRFEGFPNVLGEAMASGLPVVSFDCPSGPSEMIRDGVNGLLVPSGNIQKMSSSLERLMTSVELRKNLGEQARKITETYSLDKIINIWEELIVEIINESKI